jgi:hypothetical protein
VPVLEETTEVFELRGGRLMKQSRTRVLGAPR